MKLGLEHLSPFQVASLRMLSAGISLLPFFIRQFRQLPLDKLPFIILSGILGNLLPAYLFCIAETHVDSGMAGILNGLTPLMTMISGVLIFHTPVVKRQLAGIGIGLVGVMLLFAVQGVNTDYWYYGLWIVLATVCYGINVNLVHRHLKGYSSVLVSATSLLFCALVALPVLYITQFTTVLSEPVIPWSSIGASATLGILGSGTATVLFY